MTPANRTMTIIAAAACLLWSGCQRESDGDFGSRDARAATVPDRSQTAGTALPPTAGTVAPGATPGIKRPVWPPGQLDITFDDIKLDLKKDEPFHRAVLTGRIEQLDGREIRIRGYILPSFRQRGITQFVLVRDNLECCFGPGAALHDCILVQMEPDRSTSYTVRPVTVDGTFAIRELQGPDGETLAIYHLAGQGVK